MLVLNPEIKALKLGQVVFPGQPIGIIESLKLLTFRVFAIQDEGRLNALKIIRSGPEARLLPPQNLVGTKVYYPADIIKKEMTKKEISKFEKYSPY
jgi:hypothetical protein